jgi:endonuclease/exonuclease/phosphatase family metal-dependent hydrolase
MTLLIPPLSARHAARLALLPLLAAVLAMAPAVHAQAPTAAPTPDKAGRPVDEPLPAGGKPVDAAATPESTIRFGSPKPIAKPAGALRVAVYNIENLFDDQDDPALSGDNEDKDMTKPESQRKAAAAAIHAINADVLGLVEVESEQAVTWFRDQFLADMGYQYVASIDAGDERGIEQAVLSRYPISDIKNWVKLPLGGVQPEKWGRGGNREAGKPITFHRSPLEVTVTVPVEAAGKYTAPDGQAVKATKPYALTLFVVHQKSGQPGGYWREKEATKTVELVKELQTSDPNRNIVVMGDFNARPDDQPIKTFIDSGMIDLFANRKKGDPTYITHESGKPIDLVLLNPAVEKELIRETRFILGTPARPQGVDYRSTPGPEGYASDHYPVVMDLIPVNRP